MDGIRIVSGKMAEVQRDERIMCDYVHFNYSLLLRNNSCGCHHKETYLKLFQKHMLPVVEINKIPNDNFPNEKSKQSSLTPTILVLNIGTIIKSIRVQRETQFRERNFSRHSNSKLFRSKKAFSIRRLDWKRHLATGKHSCRHLKYRNRRVARSVRNNDKNLANVLNDGSSTKVDHSNSSRRVSERTRPSGQKRAIQVDATGNQCEDDPVKSPKLILSNIIATEVEPSSTNRNRMMIDVMCTRAVSREILQLTTAKEADIEHSDVQLSVQTYGVESGTSRHDAVQIGSMKKHPISVGHFTSATSKQLFGSEGKQPKGLYNQPKPKPALQGEISTQRTAENSEFGKLSSPGLERDELTMNIKILNAISLADVLENNTHSRNLCIPSNSAEADNNSSIVENHGGIGEPKKIVYTNFKPEDETVSLATNNGHDKSLDFSVKPLNKLPIDFSFKSNKNVPVCQFASEAEKPMDSLVTSWSCFDEATRRRHFTETASDSSRNQPSAKAFHATTHDEQHSFPSTGFPYKPSGNFGIINSFQGVPCSFTRSINTTSPSRWQPRRRICFVSNNEEINSSRLLSSPRQDVSELKENRRQAMTYDQQGSILARELSSSFADNIPNIQPPTNSQSSTRMLSISNNQLLTNCFGNWSQTTAIRQGQLASEQYQTLTNGTVQPEPDPLNSIAKFCERRKSSNIPSITCNRRYIRRLKGNNVSPVPLTPCIPNYPKSNNPHCAGIRMGKQGVVPQEFRNQRPIICNTEQPEQAPHYSGLSHLTPETYPFLQPAISHQDTPNVGFHSGPSVGHGFLRQTAHGGMGGDCCQPCYSLSNRRRIAASYSNNPSFGHTTLSQNTLTSYDPNVARSTSAMGQMNSYNYKTFVLPVPHHQASDQMTFGVNRSPAEPSNSYLLQQQNYTSPSHLSKSRVNSTVPCQMVNRVPRGEIYVGQGNTGLHSAAYRNLPIYQQNINKDAPILYN